MLHLMPGGAESVECPLLFLLVIPEGNLLLWLQSTQGKPVNPSTVKLL
jgi:hypothetical protein